MAHAVEQEWSGLEALSGIPGLVGATPIQNVGAYGTEVSPDSSPRSGPGTGRPVAQATFAAADCGFGYRTSRFKAEPDRYLMLDGHLPAPARLAVGADPLRRAGPHPGCRWGSGCPAADVRAGRARPAGRQGDGAGRGRPRHLERRLVLHQPDPGRRRAAASLPAGAPRFPQPDGRVKTSAAWLIEHAGFGKGYGTGAGHPVDQAHAGPDQPGRGHAPTTCWTWPARSGPACERAFGITLVPEPVLVGCDAVSLSDPFAVWAPIPSSGRARASSTRPVAAEPPTVADGRATRRAGGVRPGRCPNPTRIAEFDYGYLLDGERPGAARTRGPAGSRTGCTGCRAPSTRTRSRWTDHAWTGRQLAGGVIYELHVGTFTAEGTLRRGDRPARPPRPSWASTSSS